MLGFRGGGRPNVRSRGGFRGGRGRQTTMRRGSRGQGRGGAAAVRNKKDPCSVYVSFINPIEAVCAQQLLDVARTAAASVKFGRHCYLTFATESEASTTLAKAGEVEFGGQKPYVDHAYKSQSAKAAGKRGAEVVQASPTKKMKSNTGGPVEKEDEKMETQEEGGGGGEEVEDGEKEGEMGENCAEEAA
ncbi:uncharacterized protein LOC126982107 isoform X2 [Eriocheir sinensis]|uniref:uncharacterized protein LOC126982107 isoform X2 n=1 Tax=Eriocheir sinensis TaxID=95602 RepID=UPI0021C82987|nr:uncharacterized protein LOC126982107 isoform X2 [Eriocheir sinensis]